MMRHLALVHPIELEPKIFSVLDPGYVYLRLM